LSNELKSAAGGICFLALAVGSLLAALLTDVAPTHTIAPIVGTWCLVFSIPPLYSWQRHVAWKRRERRRLSDPAKGLCVSDGIRDVDEFAGARILHEAQRVYITRAIDAQGTYFSQGIVIAVLSPLALLLLSLQLLAVPEGGPWAVGLSLSEISCLVIMIYFAVTNREPTGEWIENRVRTELFRRERFLALAGVGPYLFATDQEIFVKAMQRKGCVEGADAQTLARLIAQQDESDVTWLEILHRERPDRHVVAPDCVERMKTYLHHRIDKQLAWFSNEIRDIRENDTMWSRLLAGALLAAIVVAALHAFNLVTAFGSTAPDTKRWEVVVGTLGIVLPPLGIACLAVRTMYNFRGRSRIYEHELRFLYKQRGLLEALVHDATVSSVASESRLKMADFEFRAVALRTEQSLSAELEQWLVLIERKEHEISP
jgi:hypothetical protein